MIEKSVTSRNFLKSVENYHKTEVDSVPLLCKHPTADSVGHVIPPGGNRALPSECRQLGLASCNIGLSRTESLIIYCQKIISAEQKFVFTVTRDNHKLRCDALVATDLGEDVSGGTVFQSQNDCYAPPKQKLVYIGSDSYPYRPNQQDPVNSCGRIYTHPVKLSETTTIWPSEHIDITLPDDFVSDDEYAIEPRTTSKLNNSMSLPNMWPSPNILQAVGGKLRFLNDTTDPIILKKDDQFCHVRPTTVFSNPTLFVNDSTPTV